LTMARDTQRDVLTLHGAGHAHRTLAEGVSVRLLVQPGVEGHKTLFSKVRISNY
jgi:hypothetical protein